MYNYYQCILRSAENKNVKAFVTHGGLMSTQEAVYYGVPMIIVPLFSDQYFNAETYVEKNIAVKIVLSDISEESFTHAVHEILKNPLHRCVIYYFFFYNKDDSSCKFFFIFR